MASDVSPSSRCRRPDATQFRPRDDALSIDSVEDPTPRTVSLLVVDVQTPPWVSKGRANGSPCVSDLANHGARGDYTVWTWNRLVVPGRPLGSPAVIPTRWPG